MQNTTVACPHCHSTLETPISLHGSEVECPACKKSFIVEIKQSSTRNKMSNFAPIMMPHQVKELLKKSKNLFAWISVIALFISLISLMIIPFSSRFPQLKFSAVPSESVKNQLVFQTELNSISEYFWRKNGDKILQSLDIKEIKTNGNWAVAFYKLSLGATEVKETMFLYRTGDGYWVKVSPFTAEKRCQTNWFYDMKNRIKHFTKDSGSFDVLDL